MEALNTTQTGRFSQLTAGQTFGEIFTCTVSGRKARSQLLARDVLRSWAAIPPVPPEPPVAPVPPQPPVPPDFRRRPTRILRRAGRRHDEVSSTAFLRVVRARRLGPDWSTAIDTTASPRDGVGTIAFTSPDGVSVSRWAVSF